MKKILCVLLCCVLILGFFPGKAMAAPDWPDGPALQSESGIVMDADSGAVLYGQNIHAKQFPASITKVLTALVVLERCSLDETVTFSQNAVYNVEANSSSAGLDTGDQLSVKNCLYAMLLKSANEAANALAEHVAGTTEDFAVLMNKKAEELGCFESSFKNPSGLNDPDHYITAYDMALITRAAFQNEVFCQIVATTYYELPPSSRNPEGQGISPGNEMIKKNSANYYKDVIGGKTGYTSLAGNTLVTCAQRGDMKVVTVVLNSNFKHYEDTKALLDFAFNNFQSLKVADHDTVYSSRENDLLISGLSPSDTSAITLDKSSRIVLPADADFSDAVPSISYELDSRHPDNAIAQINYTYGDLQVGHAFLELVSGNPESANLPQEVVMPPSISQESESSADDASVSTTVPTVPTAPTDNPVGTKAARDAKTADTSRNFHIPSIVWKVMAAILVISAVVAGVYFYISYRKRKEEEERIMRRQRRMQRLQESGVSTAEFDLLLERKRSSYTTKKKHFFSRRNKKDRKNTKRYL